MLAILLLLVHVIIVPNSPLGGPGLWLGWFTFPAMLLLILLTIAPRMPLVSQFIHLAYHQWKGLHRYMGLLFILGLTHALMVEPLILHSRPLTFYVGTLAVIGVAAYLYKQFLWDRFKKHYPYEVLGVKKLNGTVAEVTLRDRGQKLAHRAGQFLYVHFDADPVLREPHPFTISSAPGEQNLRLSIKASGDWTQYLHEHLQPGAGAFVEGPHGEFNFKTGGQKQVWIAGGIGITPFLSWMRDFEAAPHGREIDFYYTTAVPEEALFLDEIERAGRTAGFRAHVSHSVRDGRLSADKVVASSGDPKDKDIYMCGPAPMIEAFRRTFTARGVPPGRIHYEEFNFR
jgi:predicted ferric reductase